MKGAVAEFISFAPNGAKNICFCMFYRYFAPTGAYLKIEARQKMCIPRSPNMAKHLSLLGVAFQVTLNLAATNKKRFMIDGYSHLLSVNLVRTADSTS